MSSKWPRVALEELLSQVEDTHSVLAGEEYPNFGIFSFGRGLFSKPVISAAKSSARTLYRVHNGQFVYSRLFAFEGAYGLVTEEFDGHFVSNEYPVFDLDQKRILPEFLLYYFMLPFVWREIARISTGMGNRRQRIHPEQILSHRLPLPQLPEQGRIVELIIELTSKIKEIKLLQQEVDDQLRSIVSGLNDQLSAGREVATGSFLELDEVKAQVVSEGSYPQVGVRGFGKGLFTKQAVSGEHTAYKSFNKLFTGAIVLSQVKGWEGAVGVAGPELDGWYVSPEYRTFRCKPGQADPDYLRYLVASPWFWTKLQKLSRGVGARRERIRPERFLDMQVAIPIFNRQRDALQILEKLKPLRSIRASASTDALRISVLDKVFRGEL